MEHKDNAGEYQKPEEKILSILENADMPLCVNTLSFLTHLPPFKVSKILSKLEKWKKVKVVTVVPHAYWQINRDKF